MHEIVTIQLGQQANYVGTHFWNTQESYFTYGDQEESPVDHDVHFRSGVGADGSDTYLPRVVIYDFKSSFGTLRRINELYEVLHDDAGRSNIWGGNTTVQQQPQIEPNAYQRHLSQGLAPPKLHSSDIRYWSDYNRIYYHPRSMVQLYESDLGPDQRAFDTWSAGEDLFSLLDNEHDLFDRDVRPIVEECDQMQGLQLLTNVEGGWSGFSAKYIERLQDELGKAATWVWALGEGQEMTPSRRATKVVNEARALFEISTLATMYIPVLPSPRKLPSYMSLEQRHPWHTSALQALVMEGLTLPARLRQSQGINAASLRDLAIALNPSDERNIAQASFKAHKVEAAAKVEGACDLSTADRPDDTRIFAEYDAARATKSSDDGYGNGHNEDIEQYRKFKAPLSFPLLDSFPSLFRLQDPGLHNVEVTSSLKVTSATSTWINNLERGARLRVSSDEREALSNGLHDIEQAYKAGYSDDEDWD